MDRFREKPVGQALCERVIERRREKQSAFLREFYKCAVAETAAKRAGIGIAIHYVWLKKFPYYKDAFAKAVSEISPVMEDEIRRRALEGDEELVVSKGAVVGTNVRKSDRMMELWAKGRMPEVYGNKHQITGPGGGPLQIQAVHEAARAILENSFNGMIDVDKVYDQHLAIESDRSK